MKILLDTDIGGDIDDAICLAYLLSEPECELLGVTTVCGEACTRASIADAICRAAGRSVPIVAGRDLPMQPIPMYPTPEGAPALVRWPHDAFESGDAAEFMMRTIERHPHEVALIAIGCMTNVAELLTRYPQAAGLLRGIYLMNGYFGADKLPKPWYNWNAWADPMASAHVFAARTPINRAVPLEVTERLTLPAEKAHSLLAAKGARGDMLRAVLDFGGEWLNASGKLTLHDPLAAVMALHPEVCSYERGYVSVETDSVDDMGKTRFVPDARGNAEIVRDADADMFFDILRQALKA